MERVKLQVKLETGQVILQPPREVCVASVDPITSHGKWSADIEETQGHKVNYPMIGDPELLRRAVENVVRNAIRYAPAQTDVELEARDEPHALTISVRDAGTGVPDELLPRLAQPFFRVEDARDYAPDSGVGLGLSIAQRAVQLHHGRLVAENAHPGLRVTLTFPDVSTA